ncbi:MAG TPA: DUF3782 domain-containing protein [Thermoanaerobaculia bacterium]
MTDQELRDLMASLTVKHAELVDLHRDLHRETERLIQQSREGADRQREEAARQRQEAEHQRRETDRYLRELGRQIGGLGEKFGSFTEGLALPSMTKILTQRFHMDFVAPGIQGRRNGRTMEVDVLAFSNSGRNEAFVVEVKSHLREEAIDQMRKILREIRDFFPLLADKKVYGILAAVHVPSEVEEKVLREGIYLARIHDGQFDLQVPDDFQPRAF